MRFYRNIYFSPNSMCVILFYLMMRIPNTVPISLHLDGIVCSKGSIYISVYNSKEAFLVPGNEISSRILESGNMSQLKIQMKVPQGQQLAIACFQDINGNKKLDTNLLGIPTEPYGFSGDVKSKWRKPRFSDAVIDLKQTQPIKIKLQYW